jgi:hypothetical protein
MSKKWTKKATQDESPKIRKQIVNTDDIIEEVIVVEDPEIQALQQEDAWDNAIDEWQDIGADHVRKVQLWEFLDDSIIPLDAVENTQLQRVLWNKTMTFTDEDDGPRQQWDEKYFEE